MDVASGSRGLKRRRGASKEPEAPPQEPERTPEQLEPVFDPCTSCSVAGSEKTFSLRNALERRTLGNILCRRGFNTRDVRPMQHFFADRQPLLLRENELGPSLHDYDKVFALSWLDRERLILGTKSNHLLEVTLTPDVSRSNIREIPLPDCRKRTNVVPEDMEHCGIHAISLSPSRTRIVTGGLLPCDAVVLEATPDGGYKSLGVFTGHQDWVFGLAFITENVFVSGSRDRSVAIWRVPEYSARRTAAIGASLSRTHHEHKVRDVRFSHGSSRVGSASSDGTFNLWDPNDLRLVRTHKLADRPCFTQRMDSNVVCLAMEKHVAAIGSNTHLAILDTRSSAPGFEREVGEDFGKAWGIRSLSFRDHLLTVGGGSGRIYFVDLRTNRFLPLDSERGKLLDAADRERRRRQAEAAGDDGDDDTFDYDFEDEYDEVYGGAAARGGAAPGGGLSADAERARGKLFLQTGVGFIQTNDNIYQDYYSDVPIRQLHHACYAHEWDAEGARLATGGGPLPSGLKGIYGGVWSS